MKNKIIITISLIISILSITIGLIYYENKKISKNSFENLKFRVAKNFNDPDSAKFRSMRLQSLEGTITQRFKEIDFEFFTKSSFSEFKEVIFYNPKLFHLCGEVNAKNRFGAYVGYKHFYISGEDSDPFIDNDSDFSRKICDISSESVVISSFD